MGEIVFNDGHGGVTVIKKQGIPGPKGDTGPAGDIDSTIFDAKGDMIAASAADTAVRIPVGSDGQLLVADASAGGGVAWANEVSESKTFTGAELRVVKVISEKSPFNPHHPTYSTGNTPLEALQAAIDAAGVVRGVVELTEPLEINGTAIMDTNGLSLRGQSVTGIEGVGAVIKSTSTSLPALKLRKAACAVENVRIIGPGNSTGTADGIVIDDESGTAPTLSRNLLHRVQVSDFPGDGIVVAKPEQLVLDGVTSNANGGKGLYLHDDGLNIGISCILRSVTLSGNLGLHQLHAVRIIGLVFENVTVLNGAAGSTLARLENCNGFVILSMDAESPSDAVGLRVGGNGGTINGGLFGTLNKGIQFSTAVNTSVAGIVVGGSVTRSLDIDASSTVRIGLFADSSTNGMLINGNGNPSLEYRHREIAFSGTITPDPRLGESIDVGTLTGNITVANPFFKWKGARLTFRFVQDGTGGRTVTWGSDFKHNWSDTGNTANKQSTISFLSDGTSWIQLGAQSPYV